MSLFTKKSPISTELIFDIESDSVCAAIVLYEAGKTPRIIYHTESEVTHKAHTDGAYLSRNMLKAVEETAEKASSAMLDLLENKTVDHSRVDKIHVVLSSPWIISKLSCVEKKFEKETVIRQSAVADLLEKERAASSKLFSVGDAAAIDAKLFEIKINGYSVSEYEGKRALSLEGTMVVSFASRKMLNEIKSHINRFFRAGDEVFHSSLILRYIALRSILPHHTDYIWLQVHGELTDVLIVQKGVCAVSGSLPFGSDTLSRKFASMTNESETTAASTLAMLDSGSNTSQMSVRQSAETRLILEKILPEWTHSIAGLVSGGKEGILPAVAYISAGNFSSVFEQAIKQFSPTTSVMRALAEIMTPFVEHDLSVPVDLSASLYSAALSLSRKL
jgi:hypothetical protein